MISMGDYNPQNLFMPHEIDNTSKTIVIFVVTGESADCCNEAL